MIRQITVIKFKPEVTPSDIDAVGDGFAKISDIVDGIARFEYGPNLQLMKGTYDYALVIDFESEAALKSYQVHPLHLEFAKNFVPLSEQAVRVHYAV